MKKDYDFSTGTRGKFYSGDAELVPPVHLDPDVLAHVQARATQRGETIDDVVNALVREDIARRQGRP